MHDSPDDVRSFLPQGQTGHVLITSRNQHWGSTALQVTVQQWEPDESRTFLQNRTGQTEGADALAEEVGHLPLALAQAGAYIAETGITLADYLALYRTRHEEQWAVESPPED